MLFHTFNTQEERRKFGGSDFIEMQYCRLEQGSKSKRLCRLMLLNIGKTIHYISLVTI